MSAREYKSREQLAAERDLEEARKAGRVPAEQDAEGNFINPHIPQFISKAPWYLAQNGPTLKHQRHDNAPRVIDGLIQSNLIQKGKKDERVTKFRKGACENCGAITHKTKECMERPRAIGAKHTGIFGNDEHIVPEKSNDYDVKRDRWNNYDTSNYKYVVEEYERVEEERKRQNVQRLQEKLQAKLSKASAKKKRRIMKQLDTLQGEDRAPDASQENEESDSDVDGDSDEEDEENEPTDEKEGIEQKDFDKIEMTRGVKKAGMPSSSLRIREDTAKYLYNLDTNSALYDAKTRSMRQNPLEHLPEDKQGLFRGDNKWRGTGQVNDIIRMQAFEYAAAKYDISISSTALPTQAEQLWKEHQRKKEELMNAHNKNLIEKYGGSEHLKKPKELQLSTTETYFEYTPDGSVIKVDKPHLMLQSKYDEDVYDEGHLAIWGSFFDKEKQKWGYACCRNVLRRSPCTAKPLIIPKEASLEGELLETSVEPSEVVTKLEI